VSNFLADRKQLMDVPPARVFYFYSQWQPGYETLKENGLVDEFIKGLPTTEFVETMAVSQTGPLQEGEKFRGTLSVIDDQVTKVSAELAEIFMITSRHSGMSMLLLCQALFMPSNKHFRLISVNSTYVVLFKNPRDTQSIANFAKQFRPGAVKYFRASYEDATQLPYTYILLDLDPRTPNNLRVRARIFSHEAPSIVYLEPKKR